MPQQGAVVGQFLSQRQARNCQLLINYSAFFAVNPSDFLEGDFWSVSMISTNCAWGTLLLTDEIGIH